VVQLPVNAGATIPDRDHAAADLVQRSQVETAPPAPATDGAPFAPVPAGTGVDGNTRARMEREDAARSALMPALSPMAPLPYTRRPSRQDAPPMDSAPPFAVAVCGIEELAGHGTLGATHVLSILDPDHPVPEAFGTFGEHAKLELRFHDIVDPRPGEIVPDRAHVDAILAFGRTLWMERASLLVHCHAGISRSTASMALLIAQAAPDMPAADVLRTVHGIREKAWPNLRLVELGDAALNRGGTLVAATHALHRLQLEVRPHIAEFMTDAGREREVVAARTSAPLQAGSG